MRRPRRYRYAAASRELMAGKNRKAEIMNIIGVVNGEAGTLCAPCRLAKQWLKRLEIGERRALRLYIPLVVLCTRAAGGLEALSKEIERRCGMLAGNRSNGAAIINK